MRIPGGIRTKLALALVLIVGAALAAAYLVVVPSLERRLVDAKLDQMTPDSLNVALLPEDPLRWQNHAESWAIALNTRAVVFDLVSRNPVALLTRADSNTFSSSGIEDNETAIEAATTGDLVRGRVSRGGSEYAEVAVPLATGQVVLLSSSLEDALSTVDLVERRLLAASALALAIAAVFGTLAAAVHARRIRRLERAANRIAEGHFDDAVIDGGDDELGQLAEAFDRMRVQLAQLDTARKAFVANASHELRTPIFSLGGFLELLADEDLDEETRRGFLLTAREQVERLTRLTSDLLDLSRMDAGRLRMEEDEVSLGEVVRTLGDELQPLAEASGHVLEVEGDEDVWALADEERVLQVARALAGNALLHTPTGTRVVLRAAARDGRVAIEVEDDGPGVPAEHRERIFDRFYRVEGAQASGSGLGLAIARELATRMGGDVRLASPPGRTVFTLDLPPVPAPDQAPAPVAA